MKTFAEAVETALAQIPIQKAVRKPEYWCGFAITADHRVFSADAWERPTEQPLLPWTPPTSQPIAFVDINGTVTPAPPPMIAVPAHEALHILAGHGLPPDDEYQDAIEDIRRIR